jgi:site-specific recombinase XerD
MPARSGEEESQTLTERGAPFSTAEYQRMVARAGEAARFSFLIHSHMLRHSCGYKLANDGHDTRAIQHYLGHRSIASIQAATQKFVATTLVFRAAAARRRWQAPRREHPDLQPVENPAVQDKRNQKQVP